MFKSVRAKLSIDGKTWKTLASNLRNQIIFYILNSYFLRLFENYVLDRPESLHSGEYFQKNFINFITENVIKHIKEASFLTYSIVHIIVITNCMLL